MQFFFNCLVMKVSLKCIMVSTKIRTTVFNIDNEKYFLSSKSFYENDFWRSCDTEDWRNDAENTTLITEIHYILKYIHIENSYFNILQYDRFTAFVLIK